PAFDPEPLARPANPLLIDAAAGTAASEPSARCDAPVGGRLAVTGSETRATATCTVALTSPTASAVTEIHARVIITRRRTGRSCPAGNSPTPRSSRADPLARSHRGLNCVVKWVASGRGIRGVGRGRPAHPAGAGPGARAARPCRADVRPAGRGP